MTADEVDRVERERREADTRYNDALTALDRAIVAVADRPLTHEDFDQLATSLIRFLQQITSFVDTKDRALAASLHSRIDGTADAMRRLDELGTQVGVLQRAIQKLRRNEAAAEASGTGQATATASRPAVDVHTPIDDVTYVGFEDQFRGADAMIAERVRNYVPLFAGARDVIDLGCGRGEFLDALKAAGVPARGVDANREMAAIARDRGLDAVHGDALAYVASQRDESVGGAIATQVVEHLEPAYLVRLLEALARKLRPGAPIVLETINAACWLAFFSSYIRDLTHVRPVHPDTLQYLVRATGFTRVEIRYSAPVPEHMKMKTIDLPADMLSSPDASAVAIGRIAHTVNANAVILNNLMFTHLDYAVVGYRP